MIWPFSPLVPVTERMSFLTNVMETPTQERRVSIRSPRSIYQYNYLFDEAEDAKAYAMTRANILGQWEVPVWSEYTLFESPELAGVTELPVDTNAEYQVGGQVFVSSGAGVGQLREVESIGSNTITLTEPTTIVAIGAAPVRTCYMSGGLGGARLFKGLTQRSVQFVTVDQADFSSTPFSSLAGAEIVTDPTLTVSALTDTVLQAATYIDNGSGLVAIESVKDYVEGRAELRFLDTDRAARWRRKRWLHNLRGREKSFWVPSWTRDFQLASPIISAAVTLDVVPLTSESPASYIGKALMIEGTTKFYRVITNAFLTAGIWRFAFSGSLGQTIPTTARISRLTRYRLDTDEVEFAQLGEVYRETSVICKEVPA